MKKNTDEAYIILCCQLIEAQLNWGTSAGWTNQDFENLSEKIREATSVMLSATTLKRIWGRVKYDSAPTVTTLNTLAQFAGFENWRRFLQEKATGVVPQEKATGVAPQENATGVAPQENASGVVPQENASGVAPQEKASGVTPQEKASGVTPQEKASGVVPQQPQGAPSAATDRQHATSSPKKQTYIWIALAAGIIIITSILGFNYIRGKKMPKPVNTEQYQFSSRKMVTEGVPNTVIFDYNATSAPEDSVFIQQNWDPSKRVQVSRQQHQSTSVYYYPGHFQAKLVVSDQVVKEHSLLIKTKGWLPMIEQTPVPVYFTEAGARSGDELGLSIAQIRDKNIPLQPEAPWVRYSNVGNWEPLTTSRFRFEAELKNDFGEGSAVCRHTHVYLLCEGGAIIIPLAAKGCISDMNLMLPRQFVSGKTSDLSGLGVNFDQWVKLRCESLNGQIRIFINDTLAFQTAMPGEGLNISGINFRFQGTGRIRNVTLKDI